MDRGKGSAGSWDPTLLMVELNQGHELTRRLQTQLRDQHQQCPDEIRTLVHGIMASWEKAMSVAAANSSTHMQHRGALTVDTSMALGGSESPPRSVTDSPPSGGSDVPFSDQESRDVSKKRKSGQDKWTQQVQLTTGSNLESPIDDGHSWRKYGQKDILGARYPRAYYRCTHRHTQGCQATKHVQRTDDNPSVFDVTYKGKHTCFPRQQQPDTTPPAHHESTATASAPALLKPTAIATTSSSLHDIFMNFGTGGLTVKTEDTGADAGASSSFSAFSFPPTPLSCPARPETNIFSCSSSPAFAPACSSGGGGGFSSPPFLSPDTSESNYFCMSPCHVSTAAGGYGTGVAGGTNGGSMHSELAEIVSAATSTTSSPLVDLDFSQADLDAALLDSSFFSWAT